MDTSSIIISVQEKAGAQRTISFTVSPRSTVGELKTGIREAMGLSHIWLAFKNAQLLEDERSLESYGIVMSSTIVVVPRLSGA
jgi:hypothetical protein